MSLGQPTDDIITKAELAQILFRRASLRLESVRQSEQRVAIAKSSDFTLTSGSDEKNLTDLETDFVIPLWIEQKIVALADHPFWAFVPTVDLAILQQRRAIGQVAVAFYGGTSQEVIAKFSYFGNELSSPFNQFRAWYSPTVPFPTTDNEGFALPDNLVGMLALDTMVYAIPLMITNAAKQLKDKPELEGQIRAWQLLLISHKEEQKEFEELFEMWRRGSRGGHRARRRMDVMRNNRFTRWAMKNPDP